MSKADIVEAALEARLLLEFICGTDRSTLYAHPDMPVKTEDVTEFRRLINKRAERIPLSHITGNREFMGLTFKVNEHVLIPRQDTEILVEEAMRYIDDGMRVLDVCTGSGCIILSLMNYKNNLRAVGIDISEDALAVAKENAELLQSSERGEIKFLQGDLFGALSDENISDKKFDVIVSNPPYIRDEDIASLSPEVRDYDPYIALCGGTDGLDFYRRIIEKAPLYLSSEGRIFLEIGCDQKNDVENLLKEAGFSDISCIKDYAQLDRVVCGQYTKNTH